MQRISRGEHRDRYSFPSNARISGMAINEWNGMKWNAIYQYLLVSLQIQTNPYSKSHSQSIHTVIITVRRVHDHLFFVSFFFVLFFSLCLFPLLFYLALSLSLFTNHFVQCLEHEISAFRRRLISMQLI